MAWDDVKATGDDITADEWNAHVADQKRRGFDSVQVFEADGTFDASNQELVFVEAVGGGGGGGGSSGINGSVACGGGGAAGGYAAGYVDTSSLSSITVTVGSVGVGSSDGASNGSGGGTSSFGSYIEAEGGDGGDGSDEDFKSTPKGGDGISGDILIKGGDSTKAYKTNTTSTIVIPATGGDSVYGTGGDNQPTTPDNFPQLAGVDGNGYGAGGSGSTSVDAGGGTAPGGDGASGVVFVHYDQP